MPPAAGDLIAQAVLAGEVSRHHQAVALAPLGHRQGEGLPEHIAHQLPELVAEPPVLPAVRGQQPQVIPQRVSIGFFKRVRQPDAPGIAGAVQLRFIGEHALDGVAEGVAHLSRIALVDEFEKFLRRIRVQKIHIMPIDGVAEKEIALLRVRRVDTAVARLRVPAVNRQQAIAPPVAGRVLQPLEAVGVPQFGDAARGETARPAIFIIYVDFQPEAFGLRNRRAERGEPGVPHIGDTQPGACVNDHAAETALRKLLHLEPNFLLGHIAVPAPKAYRPAVDPILMQVVIPLRMEHCAALI